MKNLALVSLAALLAAPAAWAETVAANGPSGAHYANGSAEPVCSVDSSLDVSCTGTTIGGVGNTNATAILSATYSGTVQCQNRGGQIVEVKTQTTEATSSGTLRPSRNGQLVVPPLSTSAPTATELQNAAVCPNGNWTKLLLGGPTLTSFVYTVTFAGFTQPYISIVGP
ncbi:conserved exported protein of unknown function [Cupriavidus taiwanensis]|uniref:hypothetical protein n=1 Tax=Cupriavidus taiwanensis TaxID=164546 RepID=UPI000E100ECB|nr:hypothetical protein [Cupriavidus taiwanensis]ULX51311.1 hypothetical protein A9P79_05010 [Cupriavidus taiwanensis]SPA42367.1 conserved exported protein of unknown function [Cupriavidus taiwanensis]